MATPGTSTDDAGRDARRSRSGHSFDPTAIDLTDVDVARLVRSVTDRCGSLPNGALGLAREATYVTVGLTILGVQRAQVARRQLRG